MTTQVTPNKQHVNHPFDGRSREGKIVKQLRNLKYWDHIEYTETSVNDYGREVATYTTELDLVIEDAHIEVLKKLVELNGSLPQPYLVTRIVIDVVRDEAISITYKELGVQENDGLELTVSGSSSIERPDRWEDPRGWEFWHKLVTAYHTGTAFQLDEQTLAYWLESLAKQQEVLAKREALLANFEPSSTDLKTIERLKEVVANDDHQVSGWSDSQKALNELIWEGVRYCSRYALEFAHKTTYDGRHYVLDIASDHHVITVTEAYAYTVSHLLMSNNDYVPEALQRDVLDAFTKLIRRW